MCACQHASHTAVATNQDKACVCWLIPHAHCCLNNQQPLLLSPVSPYALAQLPGTAVGALVQPGVAVNSHALARILPHVHLLGDGLERLQQPVDPHGCLLL